MTDADDDDLDGPAGETDLRPGCPHPRMAARVFGQEAAERAFLAARASGRAHHAWLITGPQGVGKATLAWRIARFLLAEPAGGGLFGGPGPADTLDVAPDHPVARRLRALAEPRLLLIRRGWDTKRNRARAVISVDEARRLNDFFGLSAADGGARVVIVDAADDLNPNAANALLKLLEEPPPDATLLLVAHQPSRLLPTIRSRCSELRCATLPEGDLAAALDQAGIGAAEVSGALAELAGGSAGRACDLLAQDGLALYAGIVALAAGLPRLDRQAVLALADSLAGRTAAARLDLFADLTDVFLSRLARQGAGHPPRSEAVPGEAALLSRLAPDTRAAIGWADTQQALGARLRAGRAVNLDPAALVLDMWLRIEAAAAGRPLPT